MDLLIEPPAPHWPDLVRTTPSGTILGRTLDDWRSLARRELGLDTHRPIVATGHQTLLWHPGILAKYFAAQAFADAHDLGLANLIVDQHVEGFGAFDVPIRRADGALSVRRLELTDPRPGVPMCRHHAFTPPKPPEALQLPAAIPSVADGVNRIFQAVYAHRNADNAAMQMAGAIEDVMARWVRPLPNVSATMLIQTALARAMMQAMIRDPWHCANSYNTAVAAIPEAGIGPLLIRDDYVELPLWRIRSDDRRMHAYDSDVESALSERVANQSAASLLPRALFMTALVRMGMCDLFIHGTGGANYDRAMERWIRNWLGVDVGSIAVVSATVQLPLSEGEPRTNLPVLINMARRFWHDPAAADGQPAARVLNPSERKSVMLKQIDRLPRRSAERRAAFLSMHEHLAALRTQRAEAIKGAQNVVESARRNTADALVAQRRDWAFPLYPVESIDALNAAVIAALAATPATLPRQAQR
jgi:hypothetical protein